MEEKVVPYEVALAAIVKAKKQINDAIKALEGINGAATDRDTLRSTLGQLNRISTRWIAERDRWR